MVETCKNSVGQTKRYLKNPIGKRTHDQNLWSPRVCTFDPSPFLQEKNGNNHRFGHVVVCFSLLVCKNLGLLKKPGTYRKQYNPKETFEKNVQCSIRPIKITQKGS